jgi:hypothetical protein
MAKPTPANSNELVESQLDALAIDLENHLNADVLSYSGPIISGSDGIVRYGIESRTTKRDKLAVVLETPGGYIETVHRIVDTMRHHYKIVDFFIPDRAMSAGTVLAMSGDSIYMNYYSILGPIDPQVKRGDGKGMVPALGYLVQFERLMKKAQSTKLNTAEMTFLVEKFDPAELYDYEQARELSISLLIEWLVKYKFKDWTRTATRNLRVTEKMRARRAGEIAKALNDTGRWHSHGRGISMAVLRDQLKLRIEDIDDDPDLADKLSVYHRFLVDYTTRRGHVVALHTDGHYDGIG